MFIRVRVLLVVLSFFLGCMTGCKGKQENTEQKQLFDLNWKFHQGDITSAIEVDFNDKQWRDLDLPHDWSIDGKLDRKNYTKDEGGTFISDIGWYRKKFILPSDWQNKRVAVYFEGVNMETEVYLNENLLGENSGTSDSFHFDLTPHLNYTKKNIIAVRVNSSRQKDDTWPKGAGIPRHVWLLVSDPV